MKVKVKVVSLILFLMLFTGCNSYANDPNFIEVANGHGIYINGERPTLIFSGKAVIPLVVDERIFGDWVVNFGQEDVIFTIDPNNQLYANGQSIAEWYWFTPDMILTDDGESQSLIYFEFDSGNDNLVLFTELDQSGEYFSWLGVRDTASAWRKS